jgi:aldose 1-epimerase
MQAATAPDLSAVRSYDFNFVLQDTIRGLGHVAARLADPVSGRVLEMETTEPGVQIFTGSTPRTPVRLSGGENLAKGAALAIETQHFPDSPNHAGFPSTVLVPGQIYHSVTVFRFKASY